MNFLQILLSFGICVPVLVTNALANTHCIAASSSYAGYIGFVAKLTALSALIAVIYCGLCLLAYASYRAIFSVLGRRTCLIIFLLATCILIMYATCWQFFIQ